MSPRLCSSFYAHTGQSMKPWGAAQPQDWSLWLWSPVMRCRQGSGPVTLARDANSHWELSWGRLG